MNAQPSSCVGAFFWKFLRQLRSSTLRLLPPSAKGSNANGLGKSMKAFFDESALRELSAEETANRYSSWTKPCLTFRFAAIGPVLRNAILIKPTLNMASLVYPHVRT